MMALRIADERSAGLAITEELESLEPVGRIR